MTPEVRQILQSFEMLSDAAKREAASEIIRRSLQLESPPLSDEDLVSIAEQVFLDLDRSESENA